MSRAPALTRTVRIDAAPAAQPLLVRILRAPARRALARWFALEIEGLDRLPSSGPYILAANHHNYLDGLVLATVVPEPVHFIVMPRVYRATPLHPLFHRHVGSIELDPARPEPGALRRALERLADGRVVGIFPEGPFSVRGRLERGLPGVALLALRSGAPVVPAGIHGTYQALRGRRFYVPRRHPLTIRFGAPRRFVRDGARGRDARARVTRRIMDDIAALLP